MSSTHQNKTYVQCNETKPIAEFPITPRYINSSSKCADYIRADTAERNRLYRKRNHVAVGSNPPMDALGIVESMTATLAP